MSHRLSTVIACKIKDSIGAAALIEVIQLINDQRLACRLLITHKNKSLLIEIAQQLGLFFIRSSQIVERHNGSNHIGRFKTCELTDAGNAFYYYLAKNETLARLAYFTEGSDAQLQGKLFGYPSCCINFFKARFGEHAQDLVYEVAKPVAGYSFWNNRAVKIIGYGLISHFPCSWACIFSEEIAKRTHKTLTDVLPAYAEEVVSKLNQNLLYSTDKVILLGATNMKAIPINEFIYLPFYSV